MSVEECRFLKRTQTGNAEPIQRALNRDAMPHSIPFSFGQAAAGIQPALIPVVESV
jgi:hypothetical protein